METYKKNLELLTKNHVYSKDMEHDACGVGLIASTEGKKTRAIVEYGIEALKAVWHRGAVDADGKTGDGAGIHVEIPKDFFIEKIQVTKWGTLKTDFDSMETNLKGVFAAGDIVRGASLVVWAIKDGRDAATAMKTYLENVELKKSKVA